ncbi:VCBS repeat-containing protein, partial [candidate division KSB1 bacterium]|nr:VCBS repeat-containing protein [candidate division KSB1 bacterium]
MGAYPQIADWNEDGKLDLLVGDTNGRITLFTNTGTNTNPVLTKTGFLQASGRDLTVGTRATPVVVDWNNDGRKDLLSGSASGYVYLFLNTGTNAAPVFGAATTIKANGVTIMHREAGVEVCDLNRDGKKDLLVGDYWGYIYFYQNNGTDANPVFTTYEKIQAGGSDLKIDYYARFDVADWDEDGDLDLIVGRWDARVSVFLNSNSGPTLQITSPNGGEDWPIGAIQNITWTSTGTSGNVWIELSRDNGNSWELLFANTPDDQSQPWLISGPVTTQAILQISDTDGSPSARSESPFTISAGATKQVQYSFARAGWYLISLPVTPTDNYLSILFPTALGAYGYNPDTQGYVTVTRLEPKKGYWLLIPAATVATISGPALESYTEHYSRGWHLIGATYGTNLSLQDPDDTPNGAVIALYGWNAATNSYQTVYPAGRGVLNEKEGYWLAVVADCDLTVPGTPPLARHSETLPGATNDFHTQYGLQPPPP